MELLEAALDLAAKGIPVFPCRDKRPLTGHGFKDATTDETVIRQWWGQWANAQIGMPTGDASGLAVLDIDCKNGKDGYAAVPGWEAMTPAIVRTGSGGAHLYFKMVPDLGNATGLDGVDRRANGGYVIVPPSPGYVWLCGGLGCDLPQYPDAYRPKDRRQRKRDGGQPTADVARVRAAVRVIPNDDLDHDSWQKVGLALFAATEGSEEGLEIWQEWSGKSAKHDADYTEQRWKGFHRSPPDSIGAGTIFHMANEADPDWAEPPGGRAPAFSEDALALEFADVHSGDLRYVTEWGQWMHWNGRQWQKDRVTLAFDRARSICRTHANAANKVSLRNAIASAKTVAAVERLAKADQRIVAVSDQWDADPWALNTPAGIVDLSTGELGPSRPEAFMTKMTAVSPGKDGCPLWFDHLDRVTANNQELKGFLKRLFGYALTGSTEEHALFFFYGTGANGKSVTIETVAAILGDYQKTAPVETFTESYGERHPTELAMLMGARLVSATETEEGRNWAESRIKALTGGDKIAARFMRQDFFEFTPQFKLVLTGNHKPLFRNVDEAIRRRLHLVPFTVTIPAEQRDTDLREKLKDEWPGILRWMIDGCVEWRRDGLQPPPCVAEATAEYLESQDLPRQWMEECCEKNAAEWASASNLHSSWAAWAKARNEHPISWRKLRDKLLDMGFKAEARDHNTKGIAGLKLRAGKSGPDLALF